LTVLGILIMAGSLVVPLIYIIKRIAADSVANGLISEFRREYFESKNFPESSYDMVPYVTFVAKDGHTYTIKAPSNYTTYKKVGDTVKVFYRSANPKNAAPQVLPLHFLLYFIGGLLIFLFSCFGPSLAAHFKLNALVKFFDAYIMLPNLGMQTSKLIVIYIFTSIGIMFLTAMLIMTITQSFYVSLGQNNRPVKTIGTVTKVEQETTTFGSGKDRRSNTKYASIISFAGGDGKTYTTTFPAGWDVGDEIKVRYNPLSPEDAKAEGLVSVSAPLMVLGIIAAIIIFLFLGSFTLLPLAVYTKSVAANNVSPVSYRR